MCKLVPNDFIVPETLETDKFFAGKLSAADTDIDYEAVMSSIETIQKTRGGSWPTKDLTYEDDRIDLSWHQREFEMRNTFAYIVLSPDKKEYIGCFYLYAPNTRKPAPEGTDVDASWWVTTEAFNKGIYDELYKALSGWLKEKWPFEKVFYTNNLIPVCQ